MRAAGEGCTRVGWNAYGVIASCRMVVDGGVERKKIRMGSDEGTGNLDEGTGKSQNTEFSEMWSCILPPSSTG